MLQGKDTLVGHLILGAMCLYAATVLLALAAWIVRKLLRLSGKTVPERSWRIVRIVGWVLYGIGFHVTMIAFIARWREVGHAPLQNMFEVFLTLGMLMFPLSIFCWRFLKVGAEAADAVIGFIVLFPAYCVFSAEPQKLPPALQSVLFIPHVSAYMLSYVILAKAAVQGVMTLAGSGAETPAGQQISHEAATYRMVSFGFPLLTLGLVLGAWWGKLAWGDYWNWDPKELWSLISWLIFVGYLHVRYLYGPKYPKLYASLVMAGLVAIIVTLLWVNLGRIFAGGMHSYAS
jgi:cytochrome c-type biogenesis protein CcsB